MYRRVDNTTASMEKSRFAQNLKKKVNKECVWTSIVYEIWFPNYNFRNMFWRKRESIHFLFFFRGKARKGAIVMPMSQKGMRGWPVINDVRARPSAVTVISRALHVRTVLIIRRDRSAGTRPPPPATVLHPSRCLRSFLSSGGDVDHGDGHKSFVWFHTANVYACDFLRDRLPSTVTIIPPWLGTARDWIRGWQIRLPAVSSAAPQHGTEEEQKEAACEEESNRTLGHAVQLPVLQSREVLRSKNVSSVPCLLRFRPPVMYSRRVDRESQHVHLIRRFWLDSSHVKATRVRFHSPSPREQCRSVKTTARRLLCNKPKLIHYHYF